MEQQVKKIDEVQIGSLAQDELGMEKRNVVQELRTPEAELGKPEDTLVKEAEELFGNKKAE